MKGPTQLRSQLHHSISPASVPRYVRYCSKPSILAASITRRSYTTETAPTSNAYDHNPLLPQQVDLLDRYRSLVALGKIKYDEEQIRVVMQLRRLQKELTDYAPPTIASHYFSLRSERRENLMSEAELKPWWSSSDEDFEAVFSDSRALARIKSHAEELATLSTPKGLLITGPPGSGKTFLVDLWYSSVPTPYKIRKHYNQLVLEIYRGVWEETQRRMALVHANPPSFSTPDVPWTKALRDRWRDLVKVGSLPTTWTRMPLFSPMVISTEPTIAFMVAKRLLLRHWLLVFDEIQLLDVSSANLLVDVLSWFWRMGGVVVGTSNKVPDDLYKNGVQRERLEPFVEAMKVRCPVLVMRSERDWREVRAEGGIGGSWLKWGKEEEFEQKLKALCGVAQEPKQETLYVFGRPLYVPWSSDGICRFTFSELCDESLGPADYLTLASTYHTIAITSIPILKLSSKNQARRFISLIDALYESRCRLLCLAESDPDKLFFPDALTQDANGHADSKFDFDFDPIMAESVAGTEDVYRPNVSSYDAPNMAEAREAPASPLALDKLSIFSGQDEQFAYKRALSRLTEMTSSSYGHEERWSPLPLDMRKWEGQSAGGQVLKQSHRLSSYNPTSSNPGNDFAAEAEYANMMPIRERPHAPRLKEDHVWGVREDWGERAKNWGRGAKVYENSESERTKPS